ncbi:MAG: gliding motility-associated protein GldE [Bacteroidaceae bacterium]|nr:gliding motility-associated protein GldE [Bacteroidaceae bacterium]
MDYHIPLLGDFIDGIILTAPTIGTVVALVVALFMLLISGFASASEIAFFSLTPSDLNELENEEHPSDFQIKYLLKNSQKLLATILILNNLVNVTIVMLLNYFFLKSFHFASGVVEFIVMTVVLTFLLLLFGEVMPKIYSAHRTLRFARFAASAWIVLNKTFTPLSSVLVRSTTFMNQHFARKNYALSVDELSQALELTDKEELKEENTLLEGIIRFGEETAKEVMTSRLDVVSLEIKQTFHDVLKNVVDNVYSRIPVYSGTLDHIVGILYIKDLLPHLGKLDTFRWQSLVRPAYFVPETKMIDDLLREFQSNKVHIAVVVDEFGGTSGIITMEDIIEEIVGEIRDEYDDEERSYLQIDDHTFIFEGKTLLSDFYTVTHLSNDTFDDVKGDADTVAGLVLELKGEFPKVREEVEHKDFRFQVLAMDARRITKVKFFIKLLIPFLFIAFSSCNSKKNDHSASLRTYQQITDTLPFTFQIPTSAKLVMSAAPTDSTYFFDIVFPKEKARLYATYHRLVFGKSLSKLNDSISAQRRFWKLSEESRRLVYFHTVKADAIHEEEYEDPTRHIGGLFYDLTGAVATPVQLSLTDSATYFLHASLYFDSGEMRPEKAEELSVLKLDLRRLMETFTHSYY